MQAFDRRILLLAIILIAAGSTRGQSAMGGLVVCDGTDFEGRQILLVNASGYSKAEAEQNAIKIGVNKLLFEGIREGSKGCSVKPLVPEINAREDHEKYFNKYFDKKAKKIVEIVNQHTQKIGKNAKQQTYQFKLIVDVPQLEKRMRKADITPK